MPESARHVMPLLRHLVHMQSNHVPLIEALDIWRQSCRGERRRHHITQLMERLRMGQTLSDALARGGWLHGTALALSKAAESNGIWATQMGVWLEQCERQQHLQRQLRQALLYPLLVFLLAMAVTGGVLAWVLPVFRVLFEQMQAPLPWATRALLQMHSWVKAVTLPVLTMTSVMGLAIRFLRNRPTWSMHLENLIWRWPLWGKWRQMQAEARWCALLASLLDSGLDWDRALQCAGSATGHALIAQASLKIRAQLSAGTSAGRAMSLCSMPHGQHPKQGIFSPILTLWVRAAESAGDVPVALRKWAILQEEALASEWRSALRILEPVLMALLGLLMGWLVLALYLPVLQMGQMI